MYVFIIFFFQGDAAKEKDENERFIDEETKIDEQSNNIDKEKTGSGVSEFVLFSSSMLRPLKEELDIARVKSTTFLYHE